MSDLKDFPEYTEQEQLLADMENAENAFNWELAATLRGELVARFPAFAEEMGVE
jgi:hypothetical protein